jgi:hypothetical protein
VELSSREPGGRDSIPLPRPPRVRVRSRRPALEKKLVAPLVSVIRSGDLGERTTVEDGYGRYGWVGPWNWAGPVTLALQDKGPSP